METGRTTLPSHKMKCLTTFGHRRSEIIQCLSLNTRSRQILNNGFKSQVIERDCGASQTISPYAISVKQSKKNSCERII